MKSTSHSENNFKKTFGECLRYDLDMGKSMEQVDIPIRIKIGHHAMVRALSYVGFLHTMRKKYRSDDYGD